MMYRKNRNTILPYNELIMKILEHSSYNLEVEESKINYSKIGRSTLSHIRHRIKGKEVFSLPSEEPPRSRPQQENDDLPLSSSNTLNDICED